MTVYPIGDIDSYVSGEGVALELRSKTSIDDVTLPRLIDGVTFTNVRAAGIHMQERFSQDVHSEYGKWGAMDKDYFASDAPSEYFGSAYDPDGYFGESSGVDTYNPGHAMLPHELVGPRIPGGRIITICMTGL